MKISDKAQFMNLMTGIAELYRDKLSVHRIEIYWRCLQQYDFEIVKKAFERHVVNPDVGQFIPKPADVIRIITGGRANKALTAWDKVIRGLHEVGCYASVVFDDPLIHAIIIDMGGWIKLGQSLEKNMPFLAKEFESRYIRFQDQKPVSYPKKLTGLCDQVNRCQGYPESTPTFIGNTILAKQIYQSGDEQEQSQNNLIKKASIARLPKVSEPPHNP